jgi:hypothetical protein
MIGSLLWLIRSAPIQAVIDGTEQVTRKAMDAVPVDIASQDGSRRTTRSRQVLTSDVPFSSSLSRDFPLRPRR